MRPLLIPLIQRFAISSEINGVATSIHAFMNQTANLLEEELVLLRGRDDGKAPGVQLDPVYNRFVWNFTTDFTGGELAYALNYNIKDASGNVDGEISEEDAAIFILKVTGMLGVTTFRQSKLTISSCVILSIPGFQGPRRFWWQGNPSQWISLMNVNSVNAAAAKARTGAAIVNLTYRSNYSEDPKNNGRGIKMKTSNGHGD